MTIYKYQSVNISSETKMQTFKIDVYVYMYMLIMYVVSLLKDSKWPPPKIRQPTIHLLSEKVI